MKLLLSNFGKANYKTHSLLEKLSEELGIRIIMVTHIEELKVGKIVDLEEHKDLCV